MSKKNNNNNQRTPTKAKEVEEILDDSESDAESKKPEEILTDKFWSAANVRIYISVFNCKRF